MSKLMPVEDDALYEDQDIDSALAAFDRSKWKERVNKVMIEDLEPPPELEFYERPINRFR